MPLSDIVTVNITSNTVATPEAGFGVPLILSATASWTELTRTYHSLAEVADDFISSKPEYKAAAAIFSQNPPLETVKIGRLQSPPTQRFALTPTAHDTTTYGVTIDGTHIVSAASDGSATVAEIVALLKTAVDAASIAGISTTNMTTYLRITASAAGAWHSVVPDKFTDLAVAQDHADPGVSDDLDDIALEDSEWYCVLNHFNSEAMADGISDWVEANNQKLFLCDSQDSNLPRVAAVSDTTSIAAVEKAASKARTSTIYHNDNSEFAAAAWAGARLSKDPGSENWMFATLAGISPDTLTGTMLANLQGKNCNYYYTVGSRNIAAQGWVAVGEFIDIVRGRDWMMARLQERVYDVLSGSDKVPYTDEGIARIEAQVRAQIKEGIAQNFLAASPAPVVTVPLAANVSSSDKSARRLRNVNWSATVAGAVNFVTINGTISL